MFALTLRGASLVFLSAPIVRQLIHDPGDGVCSARRTTGGESRRSLRERCEPQWPEGGWHRSRSERRLSPAVPGTAGTDSVNWIVYQAIRAAIPGDGQHWEIVPPSPEQRPVLLGHYLNKEWAYGYEQWFHGRILVSPLVIRWEPSGQVVELFDGTQHGYNPEHGSGRVHALGQTEQVEYQWPDPSPTDPAFVACFCYDFDEDLELLDGEAERPEDYFGWYTLFAWDRATGKVFGITDFECA